MLPGKQLTPEVGLRILMRRWWMVAVPLLLAGVAAALWASGLPNRYRSETLIMLVPQRIPDSYVKTTVTARVEDRLATLSEQILSRSRLERIILDLDIYQPQRQRAPMEDVVHQMRSDIAVGFEGKESFRVTYVSGDPATAQRVAERLASLFIEENLRDRENVAEDTNRFLDSQLEDAKRRLIEQEKKLEVYRKRYSGQLPSQLQSNLQAIQNVEVQRTALTQAADRERERRLQFERTRAELEIAGPPTPPAAPLVPGSPESLAGAPTPQQLEAARAGLQILRLRNTPDHPDVRIMERRIRDLESKLAEERARTDAQEPTASVDPADLVRQRRMRDLASQIAAVDRQLKEYQAQDRQLSAVISLYQAKIDAVPTRESELVELTRDYATLQSSYQSLLAKREESKIAANLERRNIGEQFRILDPARVPERPFSPDRRRIVLMGIALGIGLGLALITLLEYRDSTFSTDDDVLRALSLPVLAVVPHVETRGGILAWRPWLLAGLAAVVLLGSAALVVWTRLQS